MNVDGDGDGNGVEDGDGDSIPVLSSVMAASTVKATPRDF